jgi:hypothetical protein
VKSDFYYSALFINSGQPEVAWRDRIAVRADPSPGERRPRTTYEGQIVFRESQGPHAWQCRTLARGRSSRGYGCPPASPGGLAGHESTLVPLRSRSRRSSGTVSRSACPAARRAGRRRRGRLEDTSRRTLRATADGARRGWCEDPRELPLLAQDDLRPRVRTGHVVECTPDRLVASSRFEGNRQQVATSGKFDGQCIGRSAVGLGSSTIHP